MKQLLVTNRDAGQRFDKYLKKLLPEASAGFLYKMLRKKNITLNGKKAEGKEIVMEKDTVTIFFSEDTFRKFSGKAPSEDPFLEAFRKLGEIPILYEDEDILILNKPAGILSQKAEKNDMSVNEWITGYLLKKGEITADSLKNFRPSVCNRLDRNTSGLILCGKTLQGSRFLSEMLRDRKLHKYYLAIAQGKIEEQMALTGYLKKDEDKNRAGVLSEKEYRHLAAVCPEKAGQYRKIETVIKPLAYLEEQDCTRLEVLLLTGKSHQIRAQLSAIGHPVAGDVKYGWKPEKGAKDGQLLHACRVEFPKIEGRFACLSEKIIRAPERKEYL